jgi:hypothetical protein
MSAPVNTEALLAQLLASGMTPEQLKRRVSNVRVQATRDHFAALLRDEADPTQPAVTLKVRDWRSLKDFLREPPTQEHNPGGAIFEELLHDTADAIRDNDEDRLCKNLLLIYKVVRRDA